MVFLKEIDGVGQQEGADFILFVVEEHGAPMGLLPPPGIRMLKQGGAVETPEALLIPAEMGGHPVQDHPDAVFMAYVHKVLEILGRSIPGRDGVIAGDLIAPAIVQGIFAYGHQLDVGIPHLHHVAYQLLAHIVEC